MAHMFLVDIDAILDCFEARAFLLLDDMKDSDEVPEYSQGMIKGINTAAEAFLEYISGSLNFAKFPEENEKGKKRD